MQYGLAAEELFQDVGIQPREQATGVKEAGAAEIQELEQETMQRVSLGKKRKILKKYKHKNEDGLLEHQILDGISDVGYATKKVLKRDKK